MRRRPVPKLYRRMSRRWLVGLLCWWAFMMVVFVVAGILTRSPAPFGLIVLGWLAISDMRAALATKPKPVAGSGRPGS